MFQRYPTQKFDLRRATNTNPALLSLGEGGIETLRDPGALEDACASYVNRHWMSYTNSPLSYLTSSHFYSIVERQQNHVRLRWNNKSSAEILNLVLFPESAYLTIAFH